MSIVKTQFEGLKEQFPNAGLKELADGSFLITIPDLPLADGWSHNNVTAMFLAPVGYPHAKPDCFWVDPELKVNGNDPQSIQRQPLPEVGGSYMWFSWHIGQWNPNQDSLITFVRVVMNRLEDVK